MSTVNGKVRSYGYMPSKHWHQVGLSDAGPLYLAFVASAPPVKDPWQRVNLPEGLRFYFAKNYFASVNFYILGFFLTLWPRRRRQNYLKHFIGRRMMARWSIDRWNKGSPISFDRSSLQYYEPQSPAPYFLSLNSAQPQSGWLIKWYSINIAESGLTQLTELNTTQCNTCNYFNMPEHTHILDNLNIYYSIFRSNTLAMSSTMRQMTLTPTYHSMTSPYLLHAEGEDKKEQRNKNHPHLHL